MAKPKHRRCQVCNGVTSRYSHTQDAGAFSVSVWVRDAVRGEISRRNDRHELEFFCVEHALANR